MRSSSGRGQTAIEMLLILGIMLAGLAVVIASVPSSSSDTTLVYAMRNVGADVCSYLQTGVVVNDTLHAPLNDLIARSNYSSVPCRFLGVSFVKSTSGYNVTLTFDYSGPLGTAFASDVGQFVVLKASQYDGFGLSNGTLLFHGSPVRVEVVVK